MYSDINYLLVFDRKKVIFNDIEKLKALFSIFDHVEVRNDEIIYKGINYSFSITEEHVQGDHNESIMLFDFIIRSRRNENDIESLTLLLRDIRTVVSNNHGKVIPIFDGISAYYAEKAYPKIHHVENLMRQLYAKFSIINFGNTWASSIPKEIQDKAKSKTDINPLYSLDFIHIGDAIFDEFPLKKVDDSFFDKIKKNAISEEELEDYIPRSNWERYFEKLFKCNAGLLRSKWNKLYSLRNKIAHNKEFSKVDFDEVKKLSEDVQDILSPAISKISKVEVADIIPEIVTEKALEGELIVNSPSTITSKTKSSDSDAGGLLALGLFGALLVAAAGAGR